jgi:ABC-type antimicrobial peptide transport system permease subunit
MKARALLCGGFLWLLCAFGIGQQVDTAALQARYRQLASEIAEARLTETVRWMAAQGSRVAGYPGAERAADYIEQQFRALGLQEVRREPFEVSVPIDEGAFLQPLMQQGGQPTRPIRLYPLWPNLVRTSQLPPNGITGPLLYVGDARLERFRGKEVEGSIVLTDFNCGSNWLNAPRLGAKAVIFIEPESTQRGEAEAKFIGIPIDIPRFYLTRRDAAQLLTLAATRPDLRVRLTCRQVWQKRKAYNIIGTLRGSDPKLRHQWIVITAYYDSISIVPSLAPGAESATGIAAMLELARLFKKYPPRRSVMFVANGAHFQALEGVRQFIERRLPEWSRPNVLERALGDRRKPPDIYLFVGLDLASRSRGVGVFYKGWFYDMREDIQRYFSELGRVLREHADRIAPVLGTASSKLFADGINMVQGRYWRTYIPGKPAFDAEAATLAGAWGITFATIEDARPLVDTPLDTFENCNIANIALQTRTLACLFYHILNDTNERGTPGPRFPIDEPSQWARLRLQGGFGRLHGNVYLFDPNKSFLPNTPINGSIAVVRHWMKSLMGVRGNMIQIVDDSSPIPHEQARFNFVGIPPITAYGWNRLFDIAAYHLDPETGAIDYAPDMGIQGAHYYPLTISMTVGDKETPIVVFRCVATSLYDLVDPQTLAPLTSIDIYDGDTNGEPRMYGSIMTPKNVPLSSYVEDVAVIFSQPGSRLKIKMGMGPGADRMLLINATPDNPEGKGYLVGGDPREAQGFTVPTFDPRTLTERDLIARGGAIAFTALRVAEDMYTLNDHRIRMLAKHRIVNLGINELHAAAKEALDKAHQALRQRDYAALDVYARAAWGYAARAYPDVRATANDVVNGVIFYLALLIPFAYFMERLLFAAPNLKSQLTYASLIFVAVFLAFRYIHPAFEITGNPVIVFIAFTMGALSLIVAVFISGKFEEQLRAIQKQVMGTHRADIGRMSVAMAAFNLGVSNMRRRALRTFMTSLSLVLITFVVLSFTSIVNVLRFNEVPAPGKPRYSGIMMRTPDWQPLRESAYRLMRDEFGATRAVAPRAWFFGTQIGEQAFITLIRADRRFSARAVVGMTADEARVTRIQEALVAGRWFAEDDREALVLPANIADTLGIKPADVGRARVQFAGVDYTVIGILDPNTLKRISDLDTEPLTPVDFILMQRLQSQGRQGGEGGFREYVHIEPDVVVFMPYDTVINLGGNIYSLAIEFATREEVYRILKQELMPRLGLNLYAGLGDRIVRYSTIQATTGQGLEYIILPIVIAALIVFNTMLGSVYERVREIGIFSAVGLAPNHVAMLFFAESLVYAVLGSVAGYFVAQLVAKIIVLTGWFPQLYLNFSSLSAVFATVVVVGVVLLSTIYPARKASEVATPAEERTWRLPEPEGDLWRIPLPFSVTSVQAHGLSGFLAEWFHAYEEYSVGEFITQSVRTDTFQTTHGEGYRVECDAWIAPFDLGVSQHVRIEIVPTEYEGVYDIRLTLTRLSGDIANWKRVNRRFLNILRKQFLIWRTLPQEQRERYMKLEVVGA